MTTQEPASAALYRQLRDETPGTITLVFPPHDGLVRQLTEDGWHVELWHRHYGAHQHALNQGQQSHFAVQPTAVASLTVLFWPKEKPLAHWLIPHLLHATQQVDGRLWLVGENRSGIKSATNLLAPLMLNKLATAKHCLLWQVTGTSDTAAMPLEHVAQEHSLSLANTNVTMVTLPGVFSQQHLDPGTELLLTHLPRLAPGKVLDFGCGSGVISAWLKNRQPELNVSAVDVDALSLNATHMTLQANRQQADIYPVTDFSEVKGTFRHIVTNPPFHTGQQTDLTMVETLLRRAAQHLQPGGEIWLVANAFLPYYEMLSTHFKIIEIIIHNKQYKLYYAR